MKLGASLREDVLPPLALKVLSLAVGERPLVQILAHCLHL